jgi:uncharacterized NAD-dependent epimerase/dehydratase family protein
MDTNDIRMKVRKPARKGFPEGNAIVYCEGAFGTPNGKTAHGLVRRTERYKVLSVVDSRHAGEDAGRLLDGRANGIPVVKSIAGAVSRAKAEKTPATHLVVGLAPDSGRLNGNARSDLMDAIRLGLHVDSGLHDYLSGNSYIQNLARMYKVRIRDVRKPPPVSELHFFSGKIEEVDSLVIALLGTDSAVGKRTTAWLLVDGLRRAGISTEFVGTGQTAWMQGAQYSIILDSLVNDFVSGEIEHAVWSAWKATHPRVIVIEGQGSLMNPAYPGGHEIIAAGRPDAIVLQHAPARIDYDGFPGYRIQSIGRQIEAVELISGKPVIAVTVNHEDLDEGGVAEFIDWIEETTGLPALDVLAHGPDRLVAVIQRLLEKRAAAALEDVDDEED